MIRVGIAGGMKEAANHIDPFTYQCINQWKRGDQVEHGAWCMNYEEVGNGHSTASVFRILGHVDLSTVPTLLIHTNNFTKIGTYLRLTLNT